MKKRLFVYSTLIIFAGLLCFFIASVFITYNNNLSIAKSTAIETARIYARFYSGGADASELVSVGGDTRITVISADGKVIADSRPLDIGSLENHLGRPEIQDALSGVPSAHIRHSETLGVNLIYYALKVDGGGGDGDGSDGSISSSNSSGSGGSSGSSGDYIFIRTAIPVKRISAYLFQSLPLFALLLIVIALLCFILSRSMINRIIRPFESVARKLRLLSGGEYISEPVTDSYEEIEAITKGIDEIAQLLQESFVSLRYEKGKAEYILNNIADGIFAVDENKNTVLINSTALQIFDVGPNITDRNLNYLFYDKALTSAIDDCVINEKSALFEVTLYGKIYLVTVKRLPDTQLTMVIMSDITDSRENAKRREEFFANASHELKTPLTAIKGFNELMAINNKDESIGKYIESITHVTDRMLSLIGDMLKLSELENTHDVEPVPVSLSKAAHEVRDTLLAAINEKSISVEIVGDGIVNAEAEHVYELVKNLVENAVRYNNPNGSVSITIESDRDNTWLFIFDDGIGIAPEEHARIFERFYRVEKSRSQRGGGTGLGLSIVKHICALYGWKLSLKSKLGVGTEVSVTFGK